MSRRRPDHHAAHLINHVNAEISRNADGTDVPREVAVGIWTAQAHLAVASALLAVADAIRTAAPATVEETDQ
ncbi:hypothetical protein OG795_15330 [[Kitasatospora] papulosa]|uniref:hypothetical protein n=1 Tax=[Kitasatospora] papulosa TaxID=1464011 RepID=UPI003251F68F